MWTRAELKQNAKSVLRNNYWMAFAVSLVDGLLAGGLSGGLSGGASGSTSVLSGGDAGLQLEPETLLVVGLVVVATVVIALVAGFALSFFVAGPMLVGKNRYYMESREFKSSFGQLFYGFTHNYLSNACAIFVTNLFISLWSLLFIIPGVIYQLKWQQVAYILAENPNLTGKRAREISNAMTSGEKWDMFVLDLSFLGWMLLATLLCGVGNLFLTPYMEATYAELYAKQRQKVLERGLVSYEELPGVAMHV